MDPLNNVTSEAHRLASQARRAFLEGHIETCKAELAELTNYLTEGYKAEYTSTNANLPNRRSCHKVPG